MTARGDNLRRFGLVVDAMILQNGRGEFQNDSSGALALTWGEKKEEGKKLDEGREGEVVRSSSATHLLKEDDDIEPRGWSVQVCSGGGEMQCF